MRKETRPVDVFIANDGIEFTDEGECLKHDEVIKNTRYFRITCNPDLTEGRGYYIRYFVKCMFGTDSLMFVEEYCRKEFGRGYDFVMGCIGLNAVMRKYHITEVTLEKALEESKYRNENTMCKLDKCMYLTLDEKGDVQAERQITYI